MTGLFLSLLNRSIAAGWLVLAIVLVRLVFKKAPKWLNCLLWGLVAVRLVCPISIQSAFSLIPSAETVPQEIVSADTPAIHSGISAVNSVVNPVLSETMSPVEYFSVTPMQAAAFVVSVVWAAGMAAMVVYALVSYLRIRRKVRVSLESEDGVWLCDEIDTPFILGLLRPRIYLPSALEEGEKVHVLAHERAHLKRRDHWWKPLGFGLLAVNWFNPLMWVAYVLLCRDIELACDEKVIRGMGAEEKKGYSMALLRCSVTRRTLAACPLAFGEVGVKARIKAVLNYKKPAFWVILAAMVLCVIVAACFLTDPVGVNLDAGLEDALHQAILMEDGYEPEGAFRCEAHTVLGTKKSGETVTIYAMVLQQTYICENGALVKESASHGPMAYTFARTQSGYDLIEEWYPQDGSYYSSSIREKFPWYLWLRVDTQDYIDAHQADCQAQALAYFGTAPADAEEENRLHGNYMLRGDASGQALMLSFDQENGSFAMRDPYMSYSSALAEGSYSWQDGMLVLNDNGTDYYFRRDGENLVFQRWTAPSYASGWMTLKAGAQFCPIQENAAFMLDFVWFDIDGDGVEEYCTLGMGPTSGLLTFTFDVYENGVLEYSSVFNTDSYDLSFVFDGDTLRVKGVTQDEVPQEHYFDIALEGAYVILTENGQRLELWGTQLAADSLAYEEYVSQAQTELSWYPRLTFNHEEQTYSFAYCGYSSYLDFGTYALEGNTLTLITQDGRCRYVFSLEGSGLVYDASASRPYSLMTLEDGTLFYPIQDETGKMIDFIWFDIDGDGVEEYCTMRGGTEEDRTSRIRIYEHGVLEYSGASAGTGFEIVDGELRLTRTPEWEGEPSGWYEITLEGDRVVTTLRGVA